MICCEVHRARFCCSDGSVELRKCLRWTGRAVCVSRRARLSFSGAIALLCCLSFTGVVSALDPSFDLDSPRNTISASAYLIRSITNLWSSRGGLKLQYQLAGLTKKEIARPAPCTPSNDETSPADRPAAGVDSVEVG